MIGKVFLVGAGPGDPKLLTVRAHELLSRCDVLAHDELVPDDILSIAPRRAERIRVGRRGGGVRHHGARIHPLVVMRALAGRDVVRLKGGDPMIFGRGGEEVDELRAAGIPFEVVPGITAALGAAASLAFPLTHRDVADAVTLRTAHRADNRKSRAETLVFYMGLGELDSLARELVAGGHAPETPALVVSNATRKTQKHVLATLETIAARTRAARIEAPAILFVGRAVASAAAPARVLRLVRSTPTTRPRLAAR